MSSPARSLIAPSARSLKLSLGFLLCAIVGTEGLVQPASAQTQSNYSGGAISIVNSCNTSTTSQCNTSSGFGSSTISVPSTGTVTTVQVTLNGLTSSGNAGAGSPESDSIFFTSFYLVSPSGQKFELLGCTGDSVDGNDDGNSGSGLDSVNVTIVDTAGSVAPVGTPWQHTGSTTVTPSSYWLDPTACSDTTLPINAQGLKLPQSDGVNNGGINETLNNTFGGGATNGNWTLYINNYDTFNTESGADPISISGWTLTLTYNASESASTATTISSSSNPLNAANTVTFTADVSSSGGTVDVGTVTFTSNGNEIPGCGSQTVSGGVATCTTTFTQGLYSIGATYSGGTGFTSSSSGNLNQLVEGTTTNEGNNKFCNAGSIPIAELTTSSIYPSIIKVTGYGAQTVSNVEVQLLDVTGKVYAQHLLVAPDGTHNLDFFDSAFYPTDNSTGSWLSFYDSAGQYPTDGSAPPENSSGSPAIYEASDLNENADTFPSSGAPAIDSAIPQVPGTINYGYDYALPSQNGPITATFESNFSGAPANGDWALYPYMSDAYSETIAGGWCIVLTVNTGNATSTAVTASPNPQVANNPVTLSAAVTSSGSPVTSGGTVTFTENGAVPQGVSSPNNAVNVNGSGVATLTAGPMSTSLYTGDINDVNQYMTVYEGDYEIGGDYSGSSTDNPSTGTYYQRFDNNTALTSGSGGSINACNAGPVITAMGTKGAFTPNPSIIKVANLPGTINTMSLTLNGFWTEGDSINTTESAIEGPTGGTLDYFSNTGDDGTVLGSAGGTTPDGNFTFQDGASGTVPQANFSPGSFKPTSYSSPHTYISSLSGFYPAPTAITYAQPSGSGTFASVFSSTNPNGTWSLFFNDTTEGSAEGAQSGWCLNFTENPVTVSADAGHSGTGAGGDFVPGETNAQITATVNVGDNTGPTGDPVGGNPLTVVDTLNSNFTYQGSSGTGWTCSNAGQTVTCTNDSAVAQGGSYPPLSINVNVASNPSSSSILNQISVSGAGVTSTTSNTDTIQIDVVPVITSAASTTFTVGSAGSFTVTATGYPAPTFSEVGNLPSGITLSSSGVLSGTPAAGSGGTYPIVITASNGGSPNATLDFTLTVKQAPVITSANTASFTSGTQGTFTVTTSGLPTAALSETGPLPSGVTFTDNGNGTATIAGTAGQAGSYPISITAQNGLLPNATQSLTLTVNPGAATHFVIPGGPEPFYTAFTFTISAYDAANNLATGYDGTVVLSSSDPGFVNLGPVTLSNGQATATGVLKTAGTDSITATDTTNPSITGTGFFTVQPGAATRFGITAPASAYVGSPFSSTLTAYDLYGNVATSYAGTVVFTSSDPNAILPGSTAISNGTGTFSATMETVGSQTITATDAANSLTGQSGTINVTLPLLVVTTANDDIGLASNCTIQATPGTGTDASCSLRDALVFASGQGAGSISFDSTAFASAQTISLSNAPLTLPTSTSITGPTSGNGVNLVTLSGSGASSSLPLFTVAGTSTSIVNLIMKALGGSNPSEAIFLNTTAGLVIQNSSISQANGSSGELEGIYNSPNASVTLINTTVSGFSSTGIFNESEGSVTVIDSTISGNQNAGIDSQSGTLTVSGSTIAGNSSAGNGAGIKNLSGSTAVIIDSTISGNSGGAAGGGIANLGTLTLANTIVAGNTAGEYADDYGSFSDDGGNLVGSSASGVSQINPHLAPLGNYGGTTQTKLPLPGSSAICSGRASDIPFGITSDQRGYPRINTTYTPGTPCVDSGSVQTNYSTLQFVQQPTDTVATDLMAPSPTIEVLENSNAVNGIPITLTYSPGFISGALTETTAGGVATFSALSPEVVESAEELHASLSITAGVNLSATSNPFNVTAPLAQITLPLPGSAVSGSTEFKWTGNLPVTQFELRIGTDLGTSNIYDGVLTTATSVIVNVPANGVKIYAQLLFVVNGAWKAVSYVYQESGAPVPPSLTTPPPSTKLTSANPVTFTWNPGGGSAAFEFMLGTTGPGSTDVYKGSVTDASSVTVSVPANGATLFARLYYNLNSVWRSIDYTYTEASTPVPPVLQLPPPMTGNTATFTWTHGSGPIAYVFRLGTTYGGDNLYSSGDITTTTATVHNMPAAGTRVYAQLFYDLGEVWKSVDYSFLVP
jgi:hypothetical protein